MKQALFENIMRYIREQRHDFLNHIQVVMGNLQLNKPERALDYLRRVTSAYQEMGAVARCENPYLALRLLLIVEHCREYGIKISVELGQNLVSSHDFQQQYIDLLWELFDLIIRHILILDEEQRWVKIVFNQVQGTNLSEISTSPDLVYGSFYSGLRELQQSGRFKSGSISVNQPPGETVVIFAQV